MSQHFQMLTRHLVKQYHHIPPSVNPQYTHTQKIQQMKYPKKLLSYFYHFPRRHSFFNQLKLAFSWALITTVI